ncbi:hypothetical protein ACEZ3G_12770 [Maribacter algicola]|uniref:Uncharacterized protein n=1 Tax=Meishania litoralis TaxID=3434685 RepID=A0ACC7LLB7_9FLAO
MKKQANILFTVIVLIGFQNVFGQNNQAEIPKSANMLQAVANSEYDLIIRINRDMNDEEIESRINVLHGFDGDIRIDFSRDESGNIKSLSGSGGKSSGSCMSDDFGFLIIGLKDGKWKSCMIGDKKDIR